MHIRAFIAEAALLSAAAASESHDPASIQKRQEDPNSVCQVFGIDFQNGGSYFINANSTAPFTLVTQFEGCNNDTASIMLVNNDTGDQYECTSVTTVSSDTSQLSTCQVSNSQLSSGQYSILTLGNNGNGNPFAYQRNFDLQVGAQQTVTATVSVPYTLSTQSTSVVTSFSTATSTSSVPNNITITDSATTQIYTSTPTAVVVKDVETITHAFYRWTKTYISSTKTSTASCTVPLAPKFPDTRCHIKPTIVPLPNGVDLQERLGPRELEHMASVDTPRAAVITHRALQKRGPDATTVTSTVTVPNSNYTVTSTILPAATRTNVEVTTSTVYTTLAPSTVMSTYRQIVTAPTPTTTEKSFAYAVTYQTNAIYVAWTSSITVTPSASASACRQAGGHFGNLYSSG